MKRLIICLTVLLPSLVFASTGDTTFSDVYTKLAGYMTGSLGQVLVMGGFIAAGIAMAGQAPMRVMMSVFGLTLAIRYGPSILMSVFGATGEMNNSFLHHVNEISKSDIVVMMIASAMFISVIIRKPESIAR